MKHIFNIVERLPTSVRSTSAVLLLLSFYVAHCIVPRFSIIQSHPRCLSCCNCPLSVYLFYLFYLSSLVLHRALPPTPKHCPFASFFNIFLDIRFCALKSKSLYNMYFSLIFLLYLSACPPPDCGCFVVRLILHILANSILYNVPSLAIYYHFDVEVVAGKKIHLEVVNTGNEGSVIQKRSKVY